MAARDSYTISTGNGDPLSVIVSDGTDSFRGTLASTDCSGILFNPAHAPRIIEQLIAQRAAAKSADESAAAENIIIERTAIARQIRIVFKASAVCLGNITVQDKLSMILDKFDPCAVPTSLEDAHKFALAIQKESRATADALHDQSSVIAALGARIAELGIVVDKLVRDAQERIARLEHRAKVYDDSGILTPIRYRFFEKHPDGMMPMIPILVDNAVLCGSRLRKCYRSSSTPAFISTSGNNSVIAVVRIEDNRWWRCTPSSTLKHVVFYSTNVICSDQYRGCVDVSSFTKHGITVHVDKSVSSIFVGNGKVVDCIWNERENITTWKSIMTIMEPEFNACVAAWNAFEPEFIDAYLDGKI